ncbi:MAG: glycosyl hydrolase 115 family protein [Bacteroidales bacterium]|nr:glycosyl hydrolase 115 family protein [Bacteroidales bacterium]
MKYTQKILLIFLLFIFHCSLNAQSTAFPETILTQNPGSADFHLFTQQNKAKILLDEKDRNTVRLAAGLFADDVERVTGDRPLLVSDDKEASKQCVIIGSIESSRFIKKLIAEKLIDVTEIKNQWEACITQVVDNPFPGVDRALVIAGSDRRGTAYGVFELSKQIGVSPWYYFADVPVRKRNHIAVKAGRYVLSSPSVKYRGIFINDEMWGLRPWAMYTHAPDEGKGIGPATYKKIFELLLRLKANLLWPAMHQKTKPFNYYEENKLVADEYGIVMGSSHIEPMLRNNIGGAEWDTEYPGEAWDYVKNRDHIYKYWEDRAKANGMYESMYTLGKRGKDDEAGSDITVPILERIFSDQREILGKWVNNDVTKVPQVLIPYTEVLGLYNNGLKVPDDVIICWPDDNFGNIRQLPNKKEQQRSGGSGIYYHFQWLNGATTAYTWTCTTPLGLTWTEMKKAYDFGVDKMWIVNVGDIKPAEINIEYFMQLAWDINSWDHSSSSQFLKQWAAREFGEGTSTAIAEIMSKHYELGYARRPESLVLWNGRQQKLSWEWFSLNNYDDEAQRRINDYTKLITRVDSVYSTLSYEMKDAFFQTVLYNVKGTALQNLKILYAQKSHTYGMQKRSSAAGYAAKAQQAENEIYELINHYNRELLTVGSKWNHMASLPGPWGGQWHQWDMPPLSFYSGEGVPRLNYALEGRDSLYFPDFSVFNEDSAFIDLYNSGNGAVYWSSETSVDWIELSQTSGVVYDETRIWVKIDYDKIPNGINVAAELKIYWSSSLRDEWADWDQLSLEEREAYRKGITKAGNHDNSFELGLSIFNPSSPKKGEVRGFVESNGYLSMEAEHFSRKTDTDAGWNIIEGLGRSGSSITVLPPTIEALSSTDKIISKSPSVEYDIYLFTEGEIKLQLNCSPGNPINADYGQRVAVALDDELPNVISYKRGNKNVMDNLMTLHANLNNETAGEHILKIWMVDPGIVIDKIIIDTGGLNESYLGPPESSRRK